MTTYTVVATSEIDADSPITESVMTRLRDNPIAITEGASGAPKVQTAGIADNAITSAKIAANQVTNSEIAGNTIVAANIAANGVGESEIVAGAVHQAELNTSRSSVSWSFSGTTLATLPGGQYGFYPQVEKSGSSAATANIFSASSATILATYIALVNSSNHTITAYQRYINSSPPFDLGDGEIPLFVFLLVNAAGEVGGSYLADVPPWAYNGETDISGKHDKQGRKWQQWPQIKRELMAQGYNYRQAIAAGVITREALADRLATDKIISVEVDQALKNRDMLEIPTPFINPAAGLTTVLVNPVGNMIEKLKGLHDAGELTHELITDHLVIDNAALKRATPPGVNAHRVRWKK